MAQSGWPDPVADRSPALQPQPVQPPLEPLDAQQQERKRRSSSFSDEEVAMLLKDEFEDLLNTVPFSGTGAAEGVLGQDVLSEEVARSKESPEKSFRKDSFNLWWTERGSEIMADCADLDILDDAAKKLRRRSFNEWWTERGDDLMAEGSTPPNDKDKADAAYAREAEKLFDMEIGRAPESLS